MDTPSSIFVDCLGIDSGAFDEGRKTATLDQSYPQFAESVFKRGGGGFPSPARLKMPPRMMDGMGWDGAEDATDTFGGPHATQQPLFVQPGGPYAVRDDDNDTFMMTLRDRGARKTPSRTPELVRSTRPSSSRKTTTSTKSELSRNSNSSNSLSTATAFTPPEPEPEPEPPKKRTRSRKVKKEEETTPAQAPPLSQEGGDEGEGQGQGQNGKRSKFLERNRIAASKCREKKKQFVSELEDKKSALEKQHAYLQVEYNSLVAEVGTLKHELMMHAKCNDGNIDKWIANEARKFVQTSDLFGHQRAAAGQPPPQQQDNPFDPYPTHQRHSSSASSVHQHQQHGLGSFSSADDGTRRDSLAFSQGTSYDFGGGPGEGAMDPAWGGSSAQTSPTDTVFPPLASPKYERDPGGMNFDHMPDELFDPEQ